jgi:hypothetical protein
MSSAGGGGFPGRSRNPGHSALHQSAVTLLHIYEAGGHGFGMTPKGQPVDHWVERLGDWLGQRKVIKEQ